MRDAKFVADVLKNNLELLAVNKELEEKLQKSQQQEVRIH
jgi:hypothetical protein